MNVSAQDFTLDGMEVLSEEEAYLLYPEAIDNWFDNWDKKIEKEYESPMSWAYGARFSNYWGVDQHGLLWHWWIHVDYEEVTHNVDQAWVWHDDNKEWEGILHGE